MDLTPYVSNLRHELAIAADAGGDDARALAERLTAPLESAVRLVLLDALSAAAAEITRDLAPGSVDLRLRGREPSFVVTPPPAEQRRDPTDDVTEMRTDRVTLSRDANSGFDEIGPRLSSEALVKFDEPGLPAADVPPVMPEGEEGAAARISFRLTEHLKGRIEEAAAQAGLSVNAWLVRAASAALESGDRGSRSDRRAPWGGQRYTGWVR